MNKDDKELLLLSVISGFLGAVTFILGRGIEQAQTEQKRAMEDARARFDHQQQNDNEGGDV